MLAEEKPADKAMAPGGVFKLARRHWLSAGMQTVLDCSLLAAAFASAYLLRFDFDLPQRERHTLLIQIPFVVLLQFVSLSVTGARNTIWRYTGLAQIKSFLYAAIVSLIVVGLMRLQLGRAYQYWRVPLSVNLVD